MNIDNLKKIDFGEIDGYGDPNLEKYFLDNGYWDRIIDNNVFFVVGKKGTGKSSIYRMLEHEALSKGCIIINKDFGEFPFEKLLKLEDDNFSKPNQYQTIWKNVILNLFVQSIAILPEEENEYYKQLVYYKNTFLGNAIDLHKEVVSRSEKKLGSLVFKGLSAGIEKETGSVFNCNPNNITDINSSLTNLIINFLKTSNFNNNLIIQFDRLDDNYNQYQNVEEYYQAIISLFKTVYSFNQLLRSKSITQAKVILYIRSDIMKAMAIRDAESARWDDFRLDLKWNVNNMREIKQSDLFKMVEKRIQASPIESENATFDSVFDIDKLTLKNCHMRYGAFNSFVLQTLFRPRDLIKLLKTIQDEIILANRFDNSIYKSALKKYSNWLVNTELANEINPVLGKDYKYVIELLRNCGSKPLSVKTFTSKYNSIKHDFQMSAIELLEYLYSVGVIENIWKDNYKKQMHRSIFRNEGDFDRNLMLKIIPSVWNGLTV